MAQLCTKETAKAVIGIAIMSFFGFFLFASYSYNIKARDASVRLPEFSNVHSEREMISNPAGAKYSNENNGSADLKSRHKPKVQKEKQHGPFEASKPPANIEETTTKNIWKTPGEDKPLLDTVTETEHLDQQTGETMAFTVASESGAVPLSAPNSVRKKSRHLPIQRSRAPQWFSKEDIDNMIHLATWNISHLETIPHHPTVDKIVFDRHGNFEVQPTTKDHLAICTDQCAVLKSYRDMYEVVAYHLDRVLGLKRALPAVARAFTGQGHLGLRYEDGRARPLIMWNSDLLHGGGFQEDQNSFELDWSTYQDVLRERCWANGKKPRRQDRCFIVHLEWARLAIFDFLLQVYDRLDRNCCGFTPTERDKCLIDGRHEDCRNPDAELMLVHIFSSRTAPSRLVFLDNAGVPERTEDNLDFRLLAGIDEVPRKAVEVLGSGRLGELLLRSLQVDRVFWNTQDRDKLTNYVHILEKRGEILANYIKEQKIAIVDDY